MRTKHFFLGLLTCLPALLHAQVIFVDADATDPTPDGTSWAKAFPDLQQALGASSAGNQIWVADGIYYPTTGTDRSATFQLINGVPIYGGFTGIENGINERDPNPLTNGTILSGDLNEDDGANFTNYGENSYQIITGTGTNSGAIIDGFTVRGGNANVSSGRNHLGGGIICDFSGSPTLRNLLVTQNQASLVGGGMYLNAASPTFERVIFLDNRTTTATGSSGVTGEGGAGYFNSANPTFINCQFLGNLSMKHGGGISNHNSDPDFTNCLFSGNIATDNGGAIYSTSSSQPTAINCTISQNTSTNGDGGGFFQNGGTLNIINSISWGNTDSGTNLALANLTTINAPSLTINHSLLEGGIYAGTSNIDGTLPSSDPLFVDPAGLDTTPGTLDDDHRLQDFSPVIGAGDSSANTTTSDLDNKPRLVPVGIDLGAYESELAATVGRIFVDDTASGANDGTSWGNAYLDLQSALTVAVAGEQIWVAEGTYIPGAARTDTFQLPNGVEIYGGFPAGGTLLTRDPADYPTILSGDIDGDDGPEFMNYSENSYHVVTSSGTDSTTLLDGFTITGGNANDSFPNNFGAGLFNDQGFLSVSNCLFLENRASNNAAGVYNKLASPSFTDCSFQGNETTFSGGAIYNEDSSPTITACTFEDNIANNSGGGISNEGSSPTVADCSFNNNHGQVVGGAIYNSTSSAPSLTNCSFVSNTSEQGAGVFNTGSATPTILNSSFLNNSAMFGGGLNNFSASATVINCSFQGNSATNVGGAIYNYFTSSSFTNCILWNNSQGGSSTTTGASVFDISSTPSYSHCLIENWDATTLNASGSGGSNNFDGTNSANDPDFVSATDLRLLSGSPAINTGDGASGGSANTNTTDLSGNPRFVGAIDLGAYEQQGVVFVDELVVGGDGTSWATAYQDLQDALGATGSGYEVHVASGTYVPSVAPDGGASRSYTFALTDGIQIYGGYSSGGGTRNPAANPTILSGDLNGDDGANFTNNSENTYHVLIGSDTSPATILDGFTIQGGNADGASTNATGGGLYLNEGSPTLANCIFLSNQARQGGGIYNRSSSPLLTNCFFENNNSEVFGGGIFNIFSNPTLTDCSFDNNSSNLGGGIYNTFSSFLTLTNCTFRYNSATILGGGIINQSSSSLLTNCLFFANSAESGGGIINIETSPTLINCAFQSNSATDGGAFYSQLSSPILINCSFQGNTANALGGAIYNNQSSPSLTNCIIWNNWDDENIASSSVYNTEMNSSPTYSHCLIQGWSPADLGDPINSLDGNDLNNDPLFVKEIPPFSSTSISGDLRLLTGSPALDVGENLANTEPLDLAGDSRTQNTTIDLGAYEGDAGVAFFLLHPTLNKTGDDNNNGLTNYTDYALGGDPTAPHDPSLQPSITGDQVTFSFRNNAADVFVEFQKSDTLLPNDWDEMILGTDYTLSTETISGSQTLQTLDLLTTDSTLFFRELFSTSFE